MAQLTFISLLALVLLLAPGLSACTFHRQVKDPEPASSDATVYGQVSVFVDHVSERWCSVRGSRSPR
jgi:hypothetical protein